MLKWKPDIVSRAHILKVLQNKSNFHSFLEDMWGDGQKEKLSPTQSVQYNRTQDREQGTDTFKAVMTWNKTKSFKIQGVKKERCLF